jgi:hypothetical protein
VNRAALARLAALAVGFLARLGLLARPDADASPELPAAVLLVASTPAWLPLHLLSLPGDYAHPESGGEP